MKHLLGNTWIATSIVSRAVQCLLWPLWSHLLNIYVLIQSQWPWVLFPALVNGRVVICRAQLPVRSFLGSSENLNGF